ncbi:MAG: CRISPR-associated endoribonuclease Cas6 [Desulfotomaculales bacterium]
MLKNSHWRVVAALQRNPEKLLDYNWREKIQKWVYSVLDGTVVGKNMHQSRYSLFVYSLLPEKGLCLPEGLKSRTGRWQFRFSSVYPEACAVIYSALAGNGTVSFDGEEFSVGPLFKEPVEANKFGTAITVLAAKLKERGFWTPADAHFIEAVKKSLANRWEFCFGKKMPETRISFLEQAEQRLVQYKNRDLLVFTGLVSVDGPAEVRRFARCVGLGQKPSCGFGYLI